MRGNRPTPFRLLTSLACVSSSFLYCTVAIPALPCTIWTSSLIYLYTRFAAVLVFCDNHTAIIIIQNTNLLPLFPFAHTEPTASKYSH